jgi:hypothetical protein
MRIRAIFHSLLVAAAAFAVTPALAGTMTVAEWNFNPTDFYADSSRNGHILNGNVASSTDAPTGSGLLGSASFDGTNILGVGTSGPINLSPYSSLHITWWQKVTSDSIGVLFEHSVNYNNNPGGFIAYVNDGVGNGAVGYRGPFGANYDTFSHAHGTNNSTWEFMSADIDLTAKDSADRVAISSNGVSGTNAGYAPDVTPFANTYFHIGGRWGSDGEPHPAVIFTGLIAGLKIEGTTVPEPMTGTMALTGAFGILCYAWRKRNY